MKALYGKYGDGCRKKQDGSTSKEYWTLAPCWAAWLSTRAAAKV